MKSVALQPLAAAVLLAAPAAGAQALYKCVASDGRTVYQSERCAADARETPMRTQVAPPNPAAGPETLEGMARKARPRDSLRPGNDPVLYSGPRLPRELDGFIKVTAAYRSCTEVPGFAGRFDAAYRIFQQENAGVAESVRADAAASAELERRSAAESAQIREGLASPQARPQVAQYCDLMIGSALEKRYTPSNAR